MNRRSNLTVSVLAGLALVTGALWRRQSRIRRADRERAGALLESVGSAHQSRSLLVRPLLRGLVLLAVAAIAVPATIAALAIPAVVSAERAAAAEASASAGVDAETAADQARREAEHEERRREEEEAARLAEQEAAKTAAWERVAKELDELEDDAPLAAVVVDLATGERLLDHRGDRVLTTASVYKLHTVYSLLSRVEAGDLDRSTTIGGLPVYDCVRITIVESENGCAEAWINTIGLDGHLADAKRTGAKQTINAPLDMRASADDFVTYLTRLVNGELLNEKHTSMLLDLMSRQVHRNGIPAGVGDVGAVADKPGWLDDVRNDAAIVTVDGHGYAVVVFTGANDWEFVSDIAARIAPALQLSAVPGEPAR